MNLKSKLFGTLAAASIALSMMGGIASAADSISVTGSAQLDPRASGCTAYLTQGASLMFGTWTWDGDSYEAASGAGSKITIKGVITSASPAGCNVTVSFNGLEKDGDSTQKIGLENFWGNLPGLGASDLGPYASYVASGVTLQNQPSGDYTGELQLKDVPDTVMPGTYQGTVQIGITDGE